MDLSQPRFTSHRDSTYHMTPNLYVANCGPAVGISVEAIKSFFSSFGEVAGVHAADKSGSRIIVCFLEVSAAEAAYRTLNGCRCEPLGGRILHVQYSQQQQPLKVDSNDSLPVSLFSSELTIPGIYLLHDFISSEEEQELLSAVDSRPWKNLSKRRVQHYGYEFLYETRNVDSKNFIGELPSFVIPVLEKLVKFHGEGGNNTKLVDQLTVNEYPPGIGLSPHIDTHSAFDNMIFSLSLSGTCIMEFRKYLPWHSSTAAIDVKSLQECSSSLRKSIFLPARSMLLLSGEGRYAWHHYIPHHKVDIVRGDGIRRSSRRVSFTFRKLSLRVSFGYDRLEEVLANVNFHNIVILEWRFEYTKQESNLMLKVLIQVNRHKHGDRERCHEKWQPSKMVTCYGGRKGRALGRER